MSIKQTLIQQARKYSVIIIDGPRTSRQDSLVQEVFPEKTFISLKEEKFRKLISESPSAFFMAFAGGAVIDEIQLVPTVVRSVLRHLSVTGFAPGKFILVHRGMYKNTDSDNIGHLTVLPHEPSTSENPFDKIIGQNTQSIEGIVSDALSGINVSNKEKFKEFLVLLAKENGNINSGQKLGLKLGLTSPTANKWIRILADLGVVTFLESKNQSKPRVYFLNPALLCSLLEIKTIPELIVSEYFNSIIRAYAVSTLMRYRYDEGQNPDLYYYKDTAGVQVDILAFWKHKWAFCVSDSLDSLSAQSKGITKYCSKVATVKTDSAILYLGEQTFIFDNTLWISFHDWKKLSEGLNLFT